MASANDQFANREVIPPLGGSTTVDLAGNTSEPGESPYGAYRSAWYSWTCPDDPPPGRVKFGTLDTFSSVDTIVGVYTGELGSLTVIKENDDWPGAGHKSQVVVDFPVAGTEYKIMVGSVEPTSGGAAIVVFSWSVYALDVGDWIIAPAQVDLVLDELQSDAFSSWHPTSDFLAQAGANITHDTGLAKHGASTSSNIGGGAGSANVQQEILHAGLTAGALHAVTPTPPAGATLNLEQPYGSLYALALRVDVFSSSAPSPSTGGKVLQVPRTLFQVGASYVPRFLGAGELATNGVERGDIPAASVPDGYGGFTGEADDQFFNAGLNVDGSLEYWFAVVTDVNYAGGSIPVGSSESVWVMSPTATFPSSYPFSIRYSYQPPRYRWLYEAPYVVAVPADLTLVETAGEAGSATSVRLQALPAVPGALGAAPAPARLLGAARRLGSTPPVPVRILQPRAVFVQEPWIVTGGRAERAPAQGINAVTWAHASAYDATQGVEDALSVTLNATRRWVADPASFNTATGLWSPVRGPTTVKFKGVTDGRQYIDPGYEYDSRIGPLQRNAMIFPGSAWFTATGKMSGGTAWAIAMVMVVHGNRDSTRATLLQSFQDDPDDPDRFDEATGLQDLCLDITGDKLMVRTGGRQTYDTLRTISDRPIIVVLSGTARRTRLLVVDRRYASHDFRHPDVGPTDMRFLLGRPNVEITRRRGTARMDLMDLSTFDRDLGPKEMWQVASKLDSVYGCSR